MHDPPDDSLDVTAPATRFGIDFGPTSAPRQVCVALASGRRYHLDAGADGCDHLMVTTADGAELLRLTLDDAGLVGAGSPRRPTAGRRGGRGDAAAAGLEADSGQEITWDVPRPTWPRSSASGDTPRLSLECFAALSAELHGFPERAALLLRRYGFADHAELMRTERAWFARMAADDLLQRRWRELYEVCSRWLVVVAR
ncbi:MAG: hypothetical protein WKG00_21965 [Polyangiaceae bacterium]